MARGGSRVRRNPGRTARGSGHSTRSTLSSRVLISSYRTKFGLDIPYERGEMNVEDGNIPFIASESHRSEVIKSSWRGERCPSRMAFVEESSRMKRSPKRSPIVARSVSQQEILDDIEPSRM